MFTPTNLEIMVEDIQLERRHEADLDRLAKIGRPLSRFQERLGHFLMGLSGKEKDPIQGQAPAGQSHPSSN